MKIQLYKRQIFIALGISAAFFIPTIALFKSGHYPSMEIYKISAILGLDIMIPGFFTKKLLEKKVILILFVLGFLSIHAPLFIWLKVGVFPITNFFYYLGLFTMVFCLYITRFIPEKQAQV
ncbi:MAG: hypothetical protein Q7S53_03635 [bacterium]|nr:hypothetical protein [bacterium]